MTDGQVVWLTVMRIAAGDGLVLKREKKDARTRKPSRGNG